MSPEECIRALDRALEAAGEDIELIRLTGTGSNVAEVKVKCRARVDAVTTQEIAAGIAQTELNVILSPTQINDAQWPGGVTPVVGPANEDPRIPKMNADKAWVRGRKRTVTFVDPKFVAGEMVRINLRVSG